MADNLLYTPGSGATIASDDIAGVHHQRMKISLGADGTAVDLNGDTTGGLWAQGAVAHDAVDSGNPVKIGGRANTIAFTTVVAGDRSDIWVGLGGQVNTDLRPVSWPGGADGVNNSNIYLPTSGTGTTLLPASGLMGFNGTTWDRVRTANTGRLQVDVVTSASAASAGDVAHDAVDAGNPVKIGGKAKTSAPAAVADSDRVDAWFGQQGQLMVGLTSGTSQGADGNTTLASTMGAGGSAVYLYPQLPYGFNGTSFDRQRTVEGFDTAAANPDVGLLAVGIPDMRFPSVNLGTVVNNEQGWNTNGAAGALIRCLTATTGTFTVEVSADGTNYRSAEVRDASANNWVSDMNLTPAVMTLRVLTLGERMVRVRTVTTLGAVVAFVANLHHAQSILPVIKTGPAPHDFGYTPINFSEQFTAAQTSIAINTAPGNADNAVSATQRLVITSLTIGVGGTVSPTQVTVYYGTGAFTRGTNRTLFDHEFVASATAKPGVHLTWPVNAPEGELDQELRITTVGAANPLTVTAWGYLVG